MRDMNLSQINSEYIIIIFFWENIFWENARYV